MPNDMPDEIFIRPQSDSPFWYVTKTGEPDEVKYTRTPAPEVPQEVVEKMADAYEEERAKYIGNVNYYPNNAQAFKGAMRKALSKADIPCAKLEEIIRLIEAEKWKNKSDNIYNDVHNNAIDKAISIIREVMGMK